jgi:hypothetical protein
MGYERFSAKIFSRPFLVVKAALAGPAGGSLGCPRRALIQRHDVPGVEITDSLLQSESGRSPVPKPSMIWPPGVFGKKMSVF